MCRYLGRLFVALSQVSADTEEKQYRLFHLQKLVLCEMVVRTVKILIEEDMRAVMAIKASVDVDETIFIKIAKMHVEHCLAEEEEQKDEVRKRYGM